MYCNCNNMMKHDCKTCLLCILQGSLLFFATIFAVFAACIACVTIVMTVRLDNPPDGGLPLYAEKWIIKCSSIKSGVFLSLWIPSWRVVVLIAYSLPKLWPSARIENSHEQLLSPPGIEDLIAPVANWSVVEACGGL